MKELERLLKSEYAITLLNETKELMINIESKCYTIEEEKIKKQVVKENMKEIKKIMKGEQ